MWVREVTPPRTTRLGGYDWPLRGGRQRLYSRRLSPGESAWRRTGEEWEGARRTEKDEKNRREMRTEKSSEGMRTEESSRGGEGPREPVKEWEKEVS